VAAADGVVGADLAAGVVEALAVAVEAIRAVAERLFEQVRRKPSIGMG
jgi:hypothetical protein